MRSPRAARLVAAAALALLSACDRRPDSEAVAYVRSLSQTEEPLEYAWRRFDAAAARSDWVAARKWARLASARAASALTVLEREPASQELSTARREELVFLNHAVLGFQDFGSKDSGNDELAELRSVLRRGRAHQALGRQAALRGSR